MKKISKTLFMKINDIKKQTKNLGEGYRLFFLFICGIIAGTIFINIFSTFCSEDISIYSNYLADNSDSLSKIEKNKCNFFFYCFRKYLFQVLVIIVINFTSKGKLFNSLICFYKGGIISILICTATISYGKGGLLLFIISVFPHYLIYVPLFIYSINYGMIIKMENKKKTSMVIKGLSIESILILGTAFLETYGNLPLIKNMFL